MPVIAAFKDVLKRHRTSVRRALVRRFYRFTADDLADGLRRLGIREGDSLLVHSSFNRLEGFLGRPTDIIATIAKVVGPTGHVLMPTLPFAGSAVNYVASAPVFDVRRTPSRTGLLTELFRRQPGVVRSVHPTHAVCVSGPRSRSFVEGHHLAKTPCGRPSPYSRLLDEKGKILLLGTGIGALTFYHFVEEDLEPFLPFPIFTPQTFTLRSIGYAGEELVTETRLFDPLTSTQRRMSRIIPHLKARRMWRSRRIGSVATILLSAEDIYLVSLELAAKGTHFYDR